MNLQHALDRFVAAVWPARERGRPLSKPSSSRVMLRMGIEYELTVLDGVTRQVVRRSGLSPNLITNIGLDQFGNGGGIGGFCRIGTGTTAPANTDTQLVAQSASTATVVGGSISNSGSPLYYTEAVATFEFALGAVVGNMGEVGVGWAATGATLFSRARILDGGGSPTTISVLVTEILQVTARFRVYPTLTDATGTVTISGTSYGYTSRVHTVGGVMGIGVNAVGIASVSIPIAYAGALGAITGFPSGAQATLTAGVLSAYTSGTYFRDYTITAAIGVGNIAGGGGIKSILTGVGNGSGDIFRTQIEFSPNIPKDGTKTFSLTLRVAWARH